MRTTSETWKQIVANGQFHMETVARIYGATGNDLNGVSGSDSRGTYKEYATITAPNIKHGLLPDSTVSVGNCVAGTMNFTVMTTDTLPKSAMIVIRSRVTDGKSENPTKSEWLEFGTYWIDHRQINDNLIGLECYDAMKRGNQSYVDDSQSLSWPKTIATVVTRIAAQIGVAIDDRTTTAIINSEFGDMEIITKPDDNDTLLRILEDIGGVIGGNWCITPENRLRFVPLMSSPEPRSGHITDHNNAVIQTDQGDNLKWANLSPITTEDTVDIPVIIGSMTTASDNVISRVTMTKGNDTLYTFGDDTGFELKITDNKYTTEPLCLALYERVVGTVYSPYNITGAIYDPATELGDFVYAGDTVNSVIYTESVELGIGFSADNAAPGEDELENEYPFQTMEQRVQYVVSESKQNRTMIEQTQESITLMAESVDEFEYNTQLSINSMGASITSIQNDKANKSTLRSEFAIDPTNITLTAGEDEQGHATGTITFNAGALIVNSTNFQLDADGIMTCNGANINGAFRSNTTLSSGETATVLITNGEYSISIGSSEKFSILPSVVETTIDDQTITTYYMTVSANGSRLVLTASGSGVELCYNEPLTLNASSINILSGGQAYQGWTGTTSVDGKTIQVVHGIITSIT